MGYSAPFDGGTVGADKKRILGVRLAFLTE